MCLDKMIWLFWHRILRGIHMVWLRQKYVHVCVSSMEKESTSKEGSGYKTNINLWISFRRAFFHTWLYRETSRVSKLPRNRCLSEPGTPLLQDEQVTEQHLWAGSAASLITVSLWSFSTVRGQRSCPGADGSASASVIAGLKQGLKVRFCYPVGLLPPEHRVLLWPSSI